METILNAIREFLRSCPVFDSRAKISADYLPEGIGQYSVEGAPTSAVVRQYINGDSVRAYNFLIAGREAYGEDIIINLENAGFYEQVADWMDAQTQHGSLPQLSEGKTALSVETLSTGYISEEGSNDAKYQIQCRLTYLQTYKED